MELMLNDEIIDVYIEMKPLPPSLFPAHVVRDGAATLLFIDPAATRVQASTWTMDNLTTAEGNALRRAYGEPLRGKGRMSDAILDGMVDPDLPEIVRLPTPGAAQEARDERVPVQSRSDLR